MSFTQGRDAEPSVRPDVETVVICQIHNYLGAVGEPPSARDTLSDLGLDSIGVVTILLGLADELNLDLATSSVKLASIRTVGDMIRVVPLLSADRGRD